MRILLTILLVALPITAFALDDYDIASDDWYGLQQFVQTAESLGFEVELSPMLDWTLAPTNEPMVVIYPRAGIDGESLGDWVSDGGRVLYMDDFGQSESFLARLNVTRVEPSAGALPHNTFADDSPGFPVFTARGRHPLLEGVERIVANHPAVISNEGGPVIPYSAGGALIYDMNLGDGKAILVADASLFINQMMGIADNAVLAANALEYICQSQRPCKIHLYVGDFESIGTYRRGGLNSANIDQGVGSINNLIAKALQNLPGHELLYYLGLLLAVGLAAYLTTIFPLRRMRAYSAFVDDFYRGIPEPQSEFDWNLSRFGTPNRRLNYALPLSILKEVFEEIFLRALDLWPSEPGARPNVAEMARIYDLKYLSSVPSADRAKAHGELLQLLAELTSIPPRNRVFLDSDAHFTSTDLMRLHRRVLDTLHRMGLEHEFTQRTNGEI
ncbi:MAG: DUF4350 domain-containing protein [bacterium]